MAQAFTIVAVGCLATLMGGAWTATADDKDRKEQTGKLSGELKSRTAASKGQSVTIEILAAGEEKPRRYLVSYNPADPKAEAPFKVLLAKVNAAKLGDRVQITWVNAPKGSEGGFFVTEFEVLGKGNPKNDKLR